MKESKLTTIQPTKASLAAALTARDEEREQVYRRTGLRIIDQQPIEIGPVTIAHAVAMLQEGR